MVIFTAPMNDRSPNFHLIRKAAALSLVLAIMGLGGFFLLKRADDPAETAGPVAPEEANRDGLSERSGAILEAAAPEPEKLLERGGEAAAASVAWATPRGSTKEAALAVGFVDAERVEIDKAQVGSEHVLMQWRGRFSVSLPQWKSFLDSGEPFYLELPTGESVLARLRGHERFAARRGVYSGALLDRAGDFFLSYVNDAVSGVIRDPDREQAWEVRDAGEARQFLALVDTKELGLCGVCAAGEASRGGAHR